MLSECGAEYSKMAENTYKLQHIQALHKTAHTKSW